LSTVEIIIIIKLITQETGKPINQAKSEFICFNKFVEWNLTNAESILEDKILYRDRDSIHIQIILMSEILNKI
jgi:acyl-CoA reductase-like NAD-dependent aldehyde dehydrogenase